MKRVILSDDQLETVGDLAAANYSPEKIALYLQVDKKLFMKEWYDHDSDVRTWYDRGQLEAEFLINQKQGELAKSGNITAAQVFLKESDRIRIDNIRKMVLFGHESTDHEEDRESGI